ncbi:MAG: diguanylate cyclase (GGDEF)-like protein/PAS domain S-box-containing protein [Paraglaciecola sp.]|jgi:diguanylate cyclase (GGDEF)-like protein/PAS domain S-box-containing protein
MVKNKSGRSSDPSDILGADWFQKCANCLNDAIIITEAKPLDSPGPRILWANDIFYQSTGYQHAEVIGQSPRLLQGPLTDKSELKRLRTALENWDVCRVEILNYKKDGTTFWNEFEVTPIANEKGCYTHWISVQRDVTERRELEAKVTENEERYAHAFKGANVGIWNLIVDSDSVFLSPIWKSMLGYKEDEINHSLAFAIKLLHPDDIYGVLSDLDDLKTGVVNIFEKEFRIRHKLGHYVNVESHACAVKNDAGKIVRLVGTQIDISKRKLAEEKLNYQSSHDALTDLVNRREFERSAKELLASIVDGRSEHAACYIDLDQFKVVNDTCGHAAGDELLRQLGALMNKSIRKGDVLGRLGGDEFGILIKNCSIEDAFKVASHIKSVIEDYRFIFEDQSFRISASMGLVPIVDAKTTLLHLMKNADAACYLAKDYGRNRIHIYNDNDEDLTQRLGEMQWVNRIQKALAENRFCLYAQSIELLKDTNKVHYELLIRMQDTDGVIIPPGAFLTAAERYNLIVQLDLWVINKTFSLLHLNPSFLDKVDFVSINLSGHSLTDESVLDLIISKLSQYKVDGKKFCFEITETAAIANVVMAERFILKIKKMGCKFALDDFGSGLSSFSYLKNLPVDYLKIDGLFVKDIVEDKIDYAMVKAINEVGHTMGMETIAEYVENKGIREMLRELGVDYAQGYGIHQPQPFEEILGLSSHNQSAVRI